jgi:hypothetical protein
MLLTLIKNLGLLSNSNISIDSWSPIAASARVLIRLTTTTAATYSASSCRASR